MKRSVRYAPEVRERAVRMVLEHQGEHESQWAAIGSIANKIGCTAEALRKWVRRAERNQGNRSGMTSSDRDRLKALERENRELRRANEILRKGFGLFCRGGVTGSRAAPTEMMVSFIDDHSADYGVEPICDMAAGRQADLVRAPKLRRSC